MTSDVLFSTMSLGVHRLVGSKMMFCNADRGLLVGDIPMTLPAQQTVIEVLETVSPDEEILAGCKRLAAAGFQLALDDFEWFDGADRLMRLASIVKIDIQLIPPGELAKLYRRCRAYGVQVLAEKVETEEELERCKAIGFDLFQGYALGYPRSVSGRVLDASAMSRMRIAATLLSKELEYDELERITRSDPGMTYQLLQAAGVGRLGDARRKVHSIREALVLLGERQLQNWLAFLLLRRSVQRSDEGMATALVRARMCELLAAQRDPDLAGFGFTAGLLSAFDLLMNMTPDDVVAALDLDPQLSAAAFGDTSPMGRLVREVIAHETGMVDVRHTDIHRDRLDAASSRAYTWTIETTESLTAA
jgi:EAL and modified HD-GYP domain-containing signal transduction protein